MGHRERHAGGGRGARVGAAVAALLAAAVPARAAQQNATWIGGNGLWTDGTKWSGGVVPNNNGATTYNVLIDGGNAAASAVTYGSYNVPATYTLDSLTIDAGDTLAWPIDTIVNNTLTALNGLTINGSVTGNGGQLRVGSNQAVVGSGTITLNQTTLDSTAGTLTIGPGLTIGGFFATIGNVARPTVNQAIIAAGGNEVVTVAGSTITNTGTFKASAFGVLAFDTTFQQMSDLGTLVNNGGAFRIAGTLDNTGRTFALDSTTGNWQLGGTMRGGTLTTANGATLTAVGSNAVLDAVQLNGAFATDYASVVTVPAGQVLSGTGTITLGNLGKLYSASGTLTVGPGLTVRGATGPTSFYGLGNVARPTVNQSHVIADAGVLMVNGSSITNTGVFEAATGGVLAFGGGPYTLADLGTLTRSGGAFRIAGTLDNTGNTLVVDSVTAPWQLGCGGTGALGVGTIKGGTVQIAAGSSLLLPAGTNSVLDNVTVNGHVQFDSGSEEIDLRIPAGQTLHGNAEITFASYPFTQFITGSGGLEVAAGVTIDGGGGTVGDASVPLINRGVISADNAAQAVNVAGSSVTNFGTLRSTAGQLNILGGFTRASLGTVANNHFVAIAGTMTNTGLTTTLDTPGDGGNWKIIAGGKIVGGTLNVPAGKMLVVGSEKPTTGVTATPTLDGVTVNGVIAVGGPLKIVNGLAGTNEILGRQFGSLIADGTLTIGPTTYVHHDAGQYGFSVGDGTQAIVNQGDINADGFRINVNATSLTNSGKLRITGFGSEMWLTAASVTNTGTLAVPDQATLSVFGNLAFGTGGTLDLILGPDTFNGTLNVTGNLDLSNAADTLKLTVIAGAPGAPQTLVTYTGTLTGTFDNVSAGVVLDYSTPHQIRAVAVPEPSAAALIAVAALGGGWTRRRRRSGTCHAAEPIRVVAAPRRNHSARALGSFRAGALRANVLNPRFRVAVAVLGGSDWLRFGFVSHARPSNLPASHRRIRLPKSAPHQQVR